MVQSFRLDASDVFLVLDAMPRMAGRGCVRGRKHKLNGLYEVLSNVVNGVTTREAVNIKICGVVYKSQTPYEMC